MKTGQMMCYKTGQMMCSLHLFVILLSSGKKCAIVLCAKKVACVEVQERGHLLTEVAIGNLIES